MAPPIPRPGGLAATEPPEDDLLELPLEVIANSLLTGTFAWFDIAEAGTLTIGLFEGAVLFGTVMSGAGAVVLLFVGVGALFSATMRAQLAHTNRMIGVMTSPAGLPVMLAAEAAGYSEDDALRVGDYAKNVFAAVKLNRDVAKGLEKTREQFSALNDTREIRDFIHERFEDTETERSDAKSEGSDSRPNPFSGNFDVHVVFGPDGSASFHATITTTTDKVMDGGDRDETADDPDRGDIGDRPGPGEVDRDNNNGDRDEGGRDGDGGGGRDD